MIMLLTFWKAIPQAVKILALWIVIAAVMLLAAYRKGYDDGVSHEKAAHVKAIAEARKNVTQIETKQSQITQDVEQKHEAAQVQIRTITRTIIQKVPVYVTAKADSACTVPVGFVRLHDAAASGHLPSPSSAFAFSNDAPSGVKLSAVASTVADNYGTCNAIREQLMSLQAWERQQEVVK